MYNKNSKTSISKINLKELIEYYESHVCNYRYTYFLKEDKKLEINFNLDQIPHLLGLHYLSPTFRGVEGIDKIKKESIDLKKIRKLYKDQFKEYAKERIEYFSCVETILNGATFIEFNPLQVKPFSRIKADYMLYSDEIKTWILLGIKEINEEKIIKCVPVTLLIDRDGRFVDKQKMSKVIKFEKELII